MRITSKGQVTIPAEIREKSGLLPNTEVDFDGDVVRLIPVNNPRAMSRGARVVARLWGAGDIPMTTDEIMALTRGEE